MKARDKEIDDPFFNNINSAQLYWYCEQIYLDEKEEFEAKRDLAEYQASFVNPDGVKKIKENRAQQKVHAFASDEKFEKEVVTQDYKNNPYIQAIIKNRKNQQDQNGNILNSNDPDSGMPRLPKDLKFLKDY